MTPSKNLLSSFLFLSLASIAGGCGGDGFSTQPGDSVLTDGTTSFAVTSSGGGLVGSFPPPGAACDPQVWTYTVHIDAGQFAWAACNLNGDATDPAAYTPSSGSRALLPGELDSALTTARTVVVSARTLCGADKPALHMSVTSSSGSFTYGDDFYACRNDAPAYVESQPLDNLVSVLHELYVGKAAN
jgi:hypothetical protein